VTKHTLVVLAIALTILASAMGAYHMSAATIITGTDPAGDVMIMSYGTPPPSDVVNAADMVSVKIIFTDTSMTAEIGVNGDIPAGLSENNYSIYFLVSIVGTYNGGEAQLLIGLGQVTGYTILGNAFAVIQDSDGNLLATYSGDQVTYSVQGNKITISAPVGTSSFTPKLSDSTGSSTVVTGIADSGGAVAGIDQLDLSESGSISTGEVTTTTTAQQGTTTTTTTTAPPEYEEDPLKQTPTTNEVTISLSPPSSSKVTVDPTTNLVEVDIQGTGTTSGAAPDHVGVGVIVYYKDGNFTYDIFNGEGEWDADNDPSNGYVFQMSYMGYNINLEVRPTGPSDNPWASFSYRFYGKAPASAIEVFSSLQNIDRSYVFARAYLDRNETQWNQAYVDLPLNAGVGQITTTTGGLVTTTTTSYTGGGAAPTTTSETGTAGAPPASGGGINPLIIVGAVVAIAVIGAVVFMLKRK